MSTTKNCFSGNKSSFAMTCNRLSSYMKEKGSLKDIGINSTSTFDVKGKPESTSTETNKTTVDLLSKIESPVNKPVNDLPQYVSVDSFCQLNDSSSDLVEVPESKTAQMTIIYRGQVLVFDCISADKARNMMLAARGASSLSSSRIQNRIPVASSKDSVSEDFGARYRIIPGLMNGLDLPIARRSSLHKFLSKRKDRATERAPYQLPNRLIAAPSSDHEFDLNL